MRSGGIITLQCSHFRGARSSKSSVTTEISLGESPQSGQAAVSGVVRNTSSSISKSGARCRFILPKAMSAECISVTLSTFWFEHPGQTS